MRILFSLFLIFLNFTKMKEYYCGIDVGKTGGISILNNKDENVTLFKIPLIGNEVDLKELRNILTTYPLTITAIENVHSIMGSSSKANFQFGRVFGMLESMVSTLDLKYILVNPKEWQKTAWMGVPVQKKQGKNGNDTKATSLLAVKRLFPKESFLATSRSSVPHDGLIDATLIAYWLKNHRNIYV